MLNKHGVPVKDTTVYCTRESNNKVSTCPCTVGTGDQKYDELKWESSIISAIEKQHNL